MSVCPFCDYENIEGVDVCDRCQQPLTDSYLPTPVSAVERGLLKDRVDVLKPKSPIAVTPDTPVRDVLKLLVEKRIGCILVVDNGRIVGIFSERDALLKLNVQARELGDRPVKEFMTTSVDTLDPSAKIAFAVQRMDLGSYRHVPIVDERGVAVGVISARDILRYLTELMTVGAS